MSTLKKTTGLLLLLGAGTVIFMACNKPKEPTDPTVNNDNTDDQGNDVVTVNQGVTNEPPPLLEQPPAPPTQGSVTVTLPPYSDGGIQLQDNNPTNAALAGLIFYQ